MRRVEIRREVLDVDAPAGTIIHGPEDEKWALDLADNEEILDAVDLYRHGWPGQIELLIAKHV